MNTKSLLTGLVSGIAIVTFVSLLFVLFSSDESSPESQQFVQSPTRKAAETNDEVKHSRAQTDDFAKTLNHIAGQDSYFAQELAIRRITSDADFQTLVSMLAQSKHIEAMRLRNLVQDIVIQGLATSNPLEALNRIYDVARRSPEPDPNLDPRSLATWRMIYFVPGRAEELIRIIYQEWSLSDLDQALEHAKTLGELQVRAALAGIVDSRGDLSRGEIQAIAGQLNIESVGNDLLAEALARETIEDPQAAWRTFLESDRSSSRFLDDGKRALVQSIADAMLDNHGINVIYNIDKQLAEDDITRSSVIIQFVKQALYHDPVGAIQIAVALKPDRLRTIRTTPMMSWAEINAFDALDAVFSYEDEEIREDLLRGLHLSSQTWKDPQALIKHIRKYPRDLGASTFNRAVSELARQSPEIAATYVADITEQREKLKLSQEIAQYWSQRDVLSALDWVKSDQALEEMRSSLITVVLKELVPTDQQFAFQTALEQPLGTDLIGSESFVIQELAQYDMDSAIDLLAKARNHQTRLEAATGIGQLMLEGANSKGVLELGKALPGSSRNQYFQNLFPIWTLFDPNGLHKNIDRLASNKTKSKAAMALLREAQEDRGFSLSDKQEEEVKRYLTEEQLSSLDEVLEAAVRSRENYERTRYR